MNFTVLGVGFIVGVVSIFAGALVKFVLDVNRGEYQITRNELVVGIPCSLIIAFLAALVGYNIAWNNNVTYHEYWNGWELSAVEETIPCQRDGSCQHTYSCDPYNVTEYYECGTSKNPKTCSRVVTKWHSCPYATNEYNYSVATTIGNYGIDSHVFASNPQEWRWGSGIPGYVQRGPSQFWLDAQARIASGNPGTVTDRRDYQNYILASDSVLKSYSSDMDEFGKAGLLPALQYDVVLPYFANKVYFVGFTPQNAAEWQEHHAKLNSAVGTELQGDLHLVIVQSAAVDVNPDAYLAAVKAHWQNKEAYDKNAISKNGIIVVLGTTDGKTVSWGRANTGMPGGNENMAIAIQNEFAKGIELSPSAILGNVRGEIYIREDGKTKVRGTHDNPGILESILFGLNDPEVKFTRVSMSGGSGEGAGFTYLANEIQITFGQTVLIGIVAFFISLVVWAFLAWLPLL